MAKALTLENGPEVELVEEADRIIIRPQTTHQLEELLGQIDESNLHGEVKTNSPLGHEAW